MRQACFTVQDGDWRFTSQAIPVICMIASTGGSELHGGSRVSVSAMSKFGGVVV